MKEKVREFAWKDEQQEEIVHLAIFKGDIHETEQYITSEEQFTACGISMPAGCELHDLDELDVTCEPCLTLRNGPVAEEFIRMALEKEVVSS